MKNIPAEIHLPAEMKQKHLEIQQNPTYESDDLEIEDPNLDAVVRDIIYEFKGSQIKNPNKGNDLDKEGGEQDD